MDCSLSSSCKSSGQIGSTLRKACEPNEERVFDSDAHAFHTVFTAHIVGGSLLSVRIVLPGPVGHESVFMTARFELHVQMPHAIRSFAHGRRLGVPIVEVAGQSNLPGCRSREGERN